MSGDIRHKGVVCDIVGDRIDISVIAESACGECKVKNLCGMGDTDNKIISVIAEHPEIYKTGEEVTVSITTGMGVKAVMLVYAVPFLVLLGTLLILTETGLGEAAAGLSSLAVTALYYIILYLFKNRIEREIIFKIEKT